MSRERKRQKLHPALPLLPVSKKRTLDKKPQKVTSVSTKKKRFFKTSYHNTKN